MVGFLAFAFAATVILPSHFSGNAVFLTPALTDGRSVSILLDTGGYDLIAPATVEALGLVASPLELGNRPRATVAFPPFSPSATIGTRPTRWLIARPSAFSSTFAMTVDATLGTSWIDEPLSIDYSRRRVTFENPRRSPQAVTIEVRRTPPPAEQLPSETLLLVPVSVAGESLNMLLDTGATARILPQYRDRMPDRSEVRQVCFGSRDLVGRWHREHPDWPFVLSGAEVPGENGFRPTDMIRVDSLFVGMRRAPPTWFLARPDDETFRYLSKAFGKPVAGDLGGDALRDWKITIDPNGATLLLESSGEGPQRR
jgi:hypothetical protein